MYSFNEDTYVICICTCMCSNLYSNFLITPSAVLVSGVNEYSCTPGGMYSTTSIIVVYMHVQHMQLP